MELTVNIIYIKDGYHKVKVNFCCNKRKLVVTKVLLRQNYVCRNKNMVCCDKTFVMTKILLVAALASDTGLFLEGNLTPDPKLLAVRGLMSKCLFCAIK